jgi:hypothetical protein
MGRNLRNEEKYEKVRDSCRVNKLGNVRRLYTFWCLLLVFVEVQLLPKGKGLPWLVYAGTDGRRKYSSKPFANSALEEGDKSAPRPGRFTPGKAMLPIVQEAGWASRKFWTCTENFLLPHPPPTGFDLRTVQPVASPCTDRASPTAWILEYLPNKT